MFIIVISPGTRLIRVWSVGWKFLLFSLMCLLLASTDREISWLSKTELLYCCQCSEGGLGKLYKIWKSRFYLVTFSQLGQFVGSWKRQKPSYDQRPDCSETSEGDQELGEGEGLRTLKSRLSFLPDCVLDFKLDWDVGVPSLCCEDV